MPPCCAGISRRSPRGAAEPLPHHPALWRTVADHLWLALPLARDGKTVDMIMTISDRLAPDYEDDVGSDQLFR